MASLPHAGPRSAALGALPRLLPGRLATPDAPGWDRARLAWNLAVDQRPLAVALPRSGDEVAAVVRLAARHGLRVAPQGTGHSAAPMGGLEDTILLKMEQMGGLTIDPVARIARVEAGVTWQQVAEAAGSHGLAALAGSSPDVGVIGYTVGGGMSWLGRKHGLAASSVTGAELVTADGHRVRADRDTEADLFWAVRGGGGGLAIVTALEFRLLPIREVYAGVLWWPIERGAEVLQAWRELTEAQPPDELTTVGRYLRLPPIPEIPEPIRGRSFVVVEAIHLGDPAQADGLLTPLRALSPTMDTIRMTPASELSRLHMDPERAAAAVGDGLMLAALPAAAVEELVRVAGAPAETPLLSVEVRHLGGELGRARPGNGALASIDAEYALFAVGIAPDPERAANVASCVELVRRAMSPWAARHMYLNFAETRRNPGTLWSAQAYERLRRIKARVDPSDLIRSNHPIPPLPE